MKTIYLLRHAKSSWEDRSLRDIDRPLANRGIRAAPAMGRHMSQRGWTPDCVLCSSAARTRETWDLVSREVPEPGVVEHLTELYLAAPETILQLIRYQPDELESIMVVGHNPGIAEAAVSLCREGPEKLLEQMDRKYPTGALTAVRFDTDEWRGVTWRSGTLMGFVRPRDLRDA